ncbi:MAG: bifunctional ADP-dependent NAD(P)H-hydrate dehydratase/NAD(P)H-hydrate epimerase [Rhodobacter sp.]|nr:bifunctional ADP-dependent NAD(P)H-hydrate dehydratase/NAD(P)H-hydrate epimerase [Rhodobacter sp.]
MTELLTAAQMRAIEAAAIASGAVTGLELMERAGRGVVEAIFEEWPELRATSHRAVVLCGPGNNGGDGFVVARLLKEWGWEVEVFLYGDPERMPADARVNYERWRGMGEVGDLIAFNAWSQDYDLGIDAVFGTGLTRPIALDVGEKINTIGALPRVVAIDLPSGCCSDSGRIFTVAGEPRNDRSPRCHLTVTFQFRKLGHFTASGPDVCGKVVVTDIGLDEVAAIRQLKGKYDRETQQRPNEAVLVELLQGEAYHADFMPGWSPFSKTSDDHKYSHGHAFILAGPSGRGGAARLSARGALRIGAGVVTVGCPLEALAENAARLDAVMLRVVADGAALEAVLEDARIGVVCLGPGLGTGAREVGLVAAALGVVRAGRPLSLVLDADALTILSREVGLFGALHDGCVLTPHAGEFARLFPDIAERLEAPAVTGPAYSKVDATREAAVRAGCVVLFKGADTVIAAPDGRCAINSAHYDRAAPWLATAGSGDVLAGFIAGLLARGFSAFDAACTGAWLHVECAREFGPGLIAEDLPEMLPAVFRRLGV